MSSTIRWRNGVTLRAAEMGNTNGVVLLLMASNDNGKHHSKTSKTNQ